MTYEERATAVVAAAIAAAGQVQGTNTYAWKMKVDTLITEIGLMMQDESSQMKRAVLTLKAKVIWDVEWLGYTYEASSTRCLAHIKGKPSKWYKDGVEPLRTQRTDTEEGKRQRELLDSIPVGSRVIVWKIDEPMGSDGETVRVIGRIEVIDKVASAPPTQRPAAAESAPPPPAAVARPEPAGSSPALGGFMDKLNVAMSEAGLTAKGKIAVMRRIAEAKLLPITDVTLDKALVILGEVEREDIP
jgi:hypothetical protein